MFQIRNNVFETNSSSTHSICISKAPVPKRRFGGKLKFYIGNYGWGCDCVEPADYLYTAILVSKTEPQEYIEKIKQVLGRLGVECDFEEPTYEEWCGNQYLSHGSIDHDCECKEFIDAVMGDNDRLIRFLLGDSCVFTGNDNCDCCEKYAKCRVAYEQKYIYEQSGCYLVPNPNYDEEHFEYYFKGN